MGEPLAGREGEVARVAGGRKRGGRGYLPRERESTGAEEVSDVLRIRLASRWGIFFLNGERGSEDPESLTQTWQVHFTKRPSYNSHPEKPHI
jgi:hypothetical protein